MGVSDRARKIVPQFRGGGMERSIAERGECFTPARSKE